MFLIRRVCEALASPHPAQSMDNPCSLRDGVADFSMFKIVVLHDHILLESTPQLGLSLVNHNLTAYGLPSQSYSCSLSQLRCHENHISFS